MKLASKRNYAKGSNKYESGMKNSLRYLFVLVGTFVWKDLVQDRFQQLDNDEIVQISHAKLMKKLRIYGNLILNECQFSSVE